MQKNIGTTTSIAATIIDQILLRLCAKRGSLFWLLLATLLVSGSQPDWSPLLGILTSTLGYALFWRAALFFKKPRQRFCLALLWFATIQGVQLSWFTSDKYMGSPIIYFLILVSLALGLQFGLLTLLISSRPQPTSKLLLLASIWVIFEWSRLFVLSGFSWNPVGLALTGTLLGRQGVSVAGIFGLSFWVILTNLLFLNFFLTWKKRTLYAALTLALTPYLFGVMHFEWHQSQLKKEGREPLSVLLVQSALTPENKFSQPPLLLEEWRRIIQGVEQKFSKSLDLIVLSEGALPYGPHTPLFSAEETHPLFAPFPPLNRVLERRDPKLSHSDMARRLAAHTDADVIVGLEEVEYRASLPYAYNAAFLYPHHAQGDTLYRYEKRVLVPLGEYIPFNWCKSFLKNYGITNSLTPGAGAKVFQGKRVPLGISICYEETFGHLMKQNKRLGAQVLVNLTNDVWYPRSRLPMVHYLHGRLRSIENGIPQVRACNTGITCALDSLGRTVALLEYENAQRPAEAAFLALQLPLYQFSTLYSLTGDLLIISLCLFIIIFFILSNIVAKERSNHVTSRGSRT